MPTDSKEKILDLGVKVGIVDDQKRRWILISCTYLRPEILRDAREILMLPSTFFDLGDGEQSAHEGCGPLADCG